MSSKVQKMRKELLQEVLHLHKVRSAGRAGDDIVWSCNKEKRPLNWFERCLLRLGVLDEDYQYRFSVNSPEHERLQRLLEKISWIVHDKPIRCSTCGSENLAPDPSGYYMDAESPYGVWLLCLDYNG